MKKKVDEQKVINEVWKTFCDLCGEESLQDDFIQQTSIMGLELDLHRDCHDKAIILIRQKLGLKYD